MPLISVIVPVYNTSQYLLECLNHLVAQTLKDIEIIIINDGSTDQSDEIIRSYIKKYPHLYYYARENHGISYTRNEGIRLASGDYLMFIDSDDYIADDACEKLYHKAKTSKADIVVCDFYAFNQSKTEENRLPSFSSTRLVERPHLLFDINSSPWNKLYATDFIRKNDITFPEGLKYEDTLFVLKALYCATGIAKVDEPLMYYRMREGSETMVMNDKVFDIFPILDQINDLFKNEKDEELKSYLAFFNINRLTVYNLQQVYQKDAAVADRFLNDSFAYLDRHFPSWRNNQPFKQYNSLPKQILKRSHFLTKQLVHLLRRRVKV